MHGFLFVNKRLLISCDPGIYAIMMMFFKCSNRCKIVFGHLRINFKVKGGNVQEMAQSERISNSKTEVGKN